MVSTSETALPLIEASLPFSQVTSPTAATPSAKAAMSVATVDGRL